MKTAVSIPDDLFAEADALAKQLRQSRSALYTRALREYMYRHDPDNITAALNELCDEGLGTLDPFVAAATHKMLEHWEW
jgi:predicted transcriptional regulator